MSVHLRHPGRVPALFSRDREPMPAAGGLAAWRRYATWRCRPCATGGPATARRAASLVVSLALLAAEAPLIRAAETLLAMAIPR